MYSQCPSVCSDRFYHCSRAFVSRSTRLILMRAMYNRKSHLVSICTALILRASQKPRRAERNSPECRTSELHIDLVCIILDQVLALRECFRSRLTFLFRHFHFVSLVFVFS